MKKFLFPLLLLVAIVAFITDAGAQLNEKIDRGLVALTIDGTHAYVGWRLLENDPAGISFNIYRKEVGSNDFRKVTKEPVTASTNFIDETVKPGMAYRYRVRSIINGKESETPGEATVFMLTGNQPYISLKLNTQAKLKRLGIGDLDGDGPMIL